LTSLEEIQAKSRGYQSEAVIISLLAVAKWNWNKTK